MSKNFYISDWHYDHKNVIAFDNRPFKDVDEMNSALINNWNKVISDEDTVYVLGDMFWCNTIISVNILKQLKGNKILIKGNHDRCHDKNFKNQFVKIVDYLEIKDGEKNIVLCHYPIPCFKSHYYGWVHLYGHVHNSMEWNITETTKKQIEALFDKPVYMYNVGAMIPYMNYTPRTLDEILKASEVADNIQI